MTGQDRNPDHNENGNNQKPEDQGQEDEDDRGCEEIKKKYQPEN